ncbi:uncharacterized protein VTP21DRAFT_6346 [Calcarisporiella thermophila]|uniref:uncharacterized protein n=1 Tax=Calcarisporiella thermophila TaxID=911321 RepID=UPI00374211B8
MIGNHAGPSRTSWHHYFIYLVILGLLYHFVRTFDKPSFNNLPSTPHSTSVRIPSPIPPLPAQVNERKDAWIRQSKWINDNYSQQEAAAVAVARDVADRMFAKFQIEGIPGSPITTREEAERVRNIVNCYTRGAWIYDNTPRKLIKHFQDPIFGKCEKRYRKQLNENSSSEWQMYDAAKYIWHTNDTCPLMPVDREHWCKMLNGRHTLIVGDELQYQLHDLLLDTFRDGPTVCYGTLSCKDHTLCPATSLYKDARIRYVRNDILSNGRKNPRLEGGHPSVEIVEQPWIANSVIKYYGVVIMNRGAHYVPDEDYRKTLAESLADVRKNYPNKLLIFRSTYPGHLDCDSATAPYAQPLTAADLQDAPYHWQDFARQNAIARELVEKAGGIFLDVTHMMSMRPDGHVGGKDCWRYCIPGPMDVWSVLLYNIFRLVEGAPN